MAALIGMAIAFTACNESKDDHPVLNPVPDGAKETFLNTPEMTNTALTLTQQNADGYVHMTCSQPAAYGFAAPVRYTVEVSFDQDFATPAETGAPASVTLMTSFSDCAQINPVNSELAAAVCELSGIETEDELPTKPRQLYMRLIADMKTAGSFPNNDTGNYPNTTILSNVVSIKSVSCAYLAISVPDLPTGIYLRGSMNGWGSPAEYEFLTTKTFGVYEIAGAITTSPSNPDDKSYDHVISLTAGTEFKVADSSWGSINLGGDGAAFTVGTPFKLNGGSNIKLTVDFYGSVTLTQKGDSYTLLFTPVEQ